VPAAEGLTLEEAHRRYPDVLQNDGWVNPDAPMNPFVESGAAVNSRVRHALRRAASTVPEGHVVAVMTHGAVLASFLLGDESDVPRESSRRFGNLAVLEVAVDPAQGWSVRKHHNPVHNSGQAG
jgi:broad specificity phosphatase PhoE